MLEAMDAANTAGASEASVCAHACVCACTPAGDDGTYDISLLMLSVSNKWMLRPSNEMSPAARGTIFSSAKQRLVLPDPCAPTMARRLKQSYGSKSHMTRDASRFTRHTSLACQAARQH